MRIFDRMTRGFVFFSVALTLAAIAAFALKNTNLGYLSTIASRIWHTAVPSYGLIFVESSGNLYPAAPRERSQRAGILASGRNGPAGTESGGQSNRRRLGRNASAKYAGHPGRDRRRGQSEWPQRTGGLRNGIGRRAFDLRATAANSAISDRVLSEGGHPRQDQVDGARKRTRRQA